MIIKGVIMKKLIILVFLMPSLAYSNRLFEKRVKEGCKGYVNLSRKGWLHQRPVPTLNQGPVGLCYAFAGATLLDLYRDMYGLKLGGIKQAPSSPHYLALMYHLGIGNKNAKSLDGGDAGVAIEMIRENGMCRHDIIEKAMADYSKQQNISAVHWYAITEWFFEFYNPTIGREIESAPDRAKKLKEIFSRYTRRDRVKEVFENADFEKIYESLRPFLNKRDYASYVYSVFDQCFYPSGVMVTSKNLPPLIRKNGYFAVVNNVFTQLNQKNPVIVTYKASVLRDKNNFLKRAKNFLSRKDHQSVLIGKRIRNGKCQLLLKNTWGNYCNYTKAWECYKNKKGQEIGVWMNANDLLKASDELIYFDQSKKMKRLK